MDEALRRLVRGWLVKARNDLSAADQLAAHPTPLLDAAVYHCQQAAEKAVKGFLASHGQTLVRTHDVRFLVNEAARIEPAFEDRLEEAARITPYATAYRYPDEILEPEPEEFEAARDAAAGIVGFVLSLLPKELHPEAEAHQPIADTSSPGDDPGDAS